MNYKSVNLTALTASLAAFLLCFQVFLNNGLAQDRYFFGPDTIEGGPGNRSSTGHWSTTSPTKTSSAAPTLANDAYLQGAASGVITFSITTAEMRDLYINTSGYTLQSNTGNVNFRVRNFLGPAVSSTTITNSVATVFNFVIDGSYTAYTGNFTEGTGTLNMRKQGDGILDISGINSISYT
jgi:hypothetical protein